MAAGLGFKTFTTGEVLTAADTNGYLMQGVLVFASSAARAAAITSPQEGQYSYLKDTNSTEYYDGAAWIAAPIGDITGVTAGTGISGGGTSGTVTVTNDMATTITAAGDIVVGTGSGTYDNLPIGTTAQVLTADTTVSPYKVKWATAASGGGMTLLSTTSLTSGSSVTVSSISQDYNQLFIELLDGYSSAGGGLAVRFNSDGTTAAYQQYAAEPSAGTVYPTATPWYYFLGTSYSWTTGSYKGATDTNAYSSMLIQNYKNTTTRKQLSTQSSFENAGSSQCVNVNMGYWNDVTAITSLTVFAPSGTWTQGTLKIWGIK
jgi:hypothetical protein